MSELDNIVEIRDLVKTLGTYRLEADLDIPRGYVVGLIGENGAGKTTLIKCMTGVNRIDSGEVRLLGRPLEGRVPGDVGIVFDDCHFHTGMDGRQLNRLMGHLFPQWDGNKFTELMTSFAIPMDKKVKEYSRGMRMKVQVAVALSHDPKLLILDEATAGMDPAARDEFLELIGGFVTDENRSVIMSSHITSDLERIADYIVFIHKGRIVMNALKDEILENYGIAKGSEERVRAIGDDIIAFRREEFSCQALVADRHGVAEAFPELVVDPATLDDIMVMIIRGDSL